MKDNIQKDRQTDRLINSERDRGYVRHGETRGRGKEEEEIEKREKAHRERARERERDRKTQIQRD
jgi:hypothetical protein